MTRKRKTSIYLVIAASDACRDRRMKTICPDDPATSLRVESAQQFLDALQNNFWDAAIYAETLPEFTAEMALQILQKHSSTTPLIVLPPEKKAARLSDSIAPLMKSSRPATFSLGDFQFENGHHKADLFLRESERFFRTLTEQSGDGTLLMSATGQVLCNLSSARHLPGYENLPLVGKSLPDFLHPEDAAAFRTGLHEIAVHPGQRFTQIVRMQHGPESWRWVQTRVTNLLDEPSIQALAVNFQDMTERIQAEESRARLAAILQATPDFVCTTDTSGRLLYLNRAGRRLTGRTEQEDLTQSHIRDYLPVWANERILQEAYPTVLRDGVWGGETAVLSYDGQEIPMSQIILSHKNAAGEIEFFSSVARDLREQRRAETERLHLENQLAESQKMESIGTLAGGVAHDFNNLLTAIVGNTQLALMRLPTDHAVTLLLREVSRASERAASLTRQLLAFSRRQRLERQCIALHETIHDFLTMLQRIIGEHIEISIHFEPDLPAVFADPRQIEQVILNLAVNARDAMKNGGALRIEVQKNQPDEVILQAHPGARRGNYVQTTVSDTGEGMPAETIQHIFEPFFTTKGPDHGTGLGLAVVYGIVRQHEGWIEVSSTPGLGTSVSFWLPACADPVRESVPEIPFSPERGTETILLAEDEEMLRNLLRTVLRELGYTVLTAPDGEKAIQLFEQHKDEIDLVMLDLVMPRKGGIETWKQIQRLDKNLPVIFMTGYSTETVQIDFIEQMNARIIAKPYDIDLLGQQVRSVLDQLV